MKCEKCRDGYLIAKSGGNGYFMGCTNYKNDKTGCNNTIGTNEYLTLMNFEPNYKEPFVSAAREIAIEEKQQVQPVNIENNDKSINNTIRIEQKIYEEEYLYVLLKNIVTCLEHISENHYFGIYVLISVLRGGKRKQIIKHELNEVPEYNIYSELSRDELRAVIQWMIDNQYMLQTKSKYPVLHPTYNGNHFDECITKKQIRNLKNYMENPNREVFDEEDKEE